MSNTVGSAVAMPFGPRGHVSGTWGQGPGFDADQVDIGVLIPRHIDPGKSLFMLMLEGSVTEDGDGVGNVGVGYRYYAEELDRLFGLAAWYTTDDTNFETYDAVGLSFENIGRYFTMRLNGQYVLDDQSSLVNRQFISDEFFFQNFIGVTRQDTIETPYHYAEMLFGTPLPFLGRFGTTAHVGPYGLFNPDEDTVAGIKVAVEQHITNDIRVMTNWQHDDLTGSTTSVSVSMSFPRRSSSRLFRQTPIQDRLGDWWQKGNRVNAVISREISNVALTNPKDNEPIYIVHIDPNATSPGDGTAENPYSNILEFTNQPFIDIIRVLPREDGTPTGLQNNGPLVLFDCQRLLGSSIEHIVDAVEYSFVLPGQTGDSLPIMQNLYNDSNSAVVVLADMNEVSGIQIDGTGVLSGDFGNGIIAQAGGIMDFNINRNLFVNYREGVQLANVSGTGLLTENEFDGSGGPSDDGFFLINTDPLDLDLFLVGNNSHDNRGVGLNIVADAGTMNITTENNTLNTNLTGYGVRAETGATVNQLSYSNNSANENSSTGAVWDANGGTINIDRFFGNEFLNNGGSGAVLSAQLGGDVVLRNMWNNSIQLNGTNGIELIAEDAGSTIDANIGLQDADGTLLPNVISNNGEDGININSTSGAVITSLIINNEVDANGDDGVGVFANEGTVNIGDADHFFIQNSFSDNEGTGVELVAQGGAGVAPPATVINAYLFENQINNNLEGGVVAIGTGNNSNIDLIVGQPGDGNTINNNGEVGVGMWLNNTATGSMLVEGNSSISNTTIGGAATPWDGDGVAVLLQGDAEMTAFSVSNNGSINSNAGNGILVETFTQSLMELGFIDDNGDISGNGENGIFYRREGESILDNQFIRGNRIRNNGIDGLRIYTAGSSTDFRDGTDLFLNFIIGDGGAGNGNTITGNGDDGINLISTGDANQVTVVNGNTVDGNGANGLHAELGFFASLQGVWQNNTFNNNGGDGILIEEELFLQATPYVYDRVANTLTFIDTTFNVDILDNEMNNNAGHGLFVAAAGEYDIARNEVTFNGLDGMEFFVPGSQQNPQNVVAPAIVARGTQNLIADNGGIGLSIDNSQDVQNSPPFPLAGIDGGGLFAGQFIENQILRNGYDGVSVWNDDNDETLVDFFDNLVLNNAGYGYRLQNYDDNRRNPDPTTGDFGSGVGLADAFMRVNISGTNNVTANQGNGGNSRVDDNGLGGIYAVNSTAFSFPLNGDRAEANLDLRVFQTAIRGNGTSATTFVDGDTNVNYLTGGVLPAVPDNGNGLFIYVGTTDSGGIDADIRDNYLSGNTNVDVVFQSFTEIDSADLAVEPLLNADGSLNFDYQPDPLARLDLRFTGNVGETIDATREGAFFDNDDPFKSPAGDGNLFSNSDRLRSGQREALDVLRSSGAVVLALPAPTDSTWEGTGGVPALSGAQNAYFNNYTTFPSGASPFAGG
ncbi:MAG: hypothetical protein CMJ46_08845, partial [Planctomyces sp.]|nr:hypothetical protein [Planctomyces sp.]